MGDFNGSFAQHHFNEVEQSHVDQNKHINQSELNNTYSSNFKGFGSSAAFSNAEHSKNKVSFKKLKTGNSYDSQDNEGDNDYYGFARK